MIGLHKVQTQNLLFTFTWNVKRAQNNFVPIFSSKVRVRLMHECDLYSSKYGIFQFLHENSYTESSQLTQYLINIFKMRFPMVNCIMHSNAKMELLRKRVGLQWYPIQFCGSPLDKYAALLLVEFKIG